MRRNMIVLCSVLLISMVILSGCTNSIQTSVSVPTPTQINNVPTATIIPVPTISTTPIPTTSTTPIPSLTSVEESNSTILLWGVNGLASDPSAGIDEIRFAIGLVQGAPSIDLTKMKILFSTTNTSSIVLTQGDTANTTVFTTKLVGGKNLRLSGPIAIPVNGMDDNSMIQIAFKTDPIKANTTINIEVRPSVGAALSFTKTAPATISATNVLN